MQLDRLVGLALVEPVERIAVRDERFPVSVSGTYAVDDLLGSRLSKF